MNENSKTALELFEKFTHYVRKNDGSDEQWFDYITIVIKDEPYASDDGISPYDEYFKRVFMRKIRNYVDYVDKLPDYNFESDLPESPELTISLAENFDDVVSFFPTSIDHTKFLLLVIFLQDYVDEAFGKYGKRVMTTSQMKLRKLIQTMKNTLDSMKENGEEESKLQLKYNLGSGKGKEPIVFSTKEDYELVVKVLEYGFTNPTIIHMEEQWKDSSSKAEDNISDKRFYIWKLLNKFFDSQKCFNGKEELKYSTYAKVIYLLQYSTKDAYKNGNNMLKDIKGRNDSTAWSTMQKCCRKHYPCSYGDIDSE